VCAREREIGVGVYVSPCSPFSKNEWRRCARNRRALRSPPEQLSTDTVLLVALMADELETLREKEVSENASRTSATSRLMLTSSIFEPHSSCITSSITWRAHISP
jgi:hypothetical protein